MMTIRGIFLSVLMLMFAGLTACASRGDFTAISSKNVDLSQMKIDRTKSKGRVKGEDCQYIIVFFPTSGTPTLDEAIDQAVEPVKANLLLDAVVNHEWFWFVVGKDCWFVEGDAYDSFE